MAPIYRELRVDETDKRFLYVKWRLFTGNLELMRLIRRLRKRIAPVNTYGHNFVTYGCHMATHMCLGLLFLGGGRFDGILDELTMSIH